ncbi:fatty acid oxidation complex subunit alpha FadB [Litorivicinus lipolyticus]|uniref:enoyl-CoA hydratase n=1 Tax=Litorivicinus lipolyticus TaxID=418701 RepID=A0A5Q2QAU7_9GAMM|nr:3-hydroxyacyl-CoA dehydrogenase NAD-binding domain-containing protein [Litorivicinus lipolyticus]QGG80383.1 fatty acid oxidation complex subunit alpha FadB [Litorivicinus lipolyticus]
MNTVQLTAGADRWVMTLNQPKVNVLGEQLINDLDAAITCVEADPKRLLIVQSAHKDFVLGADINAFLVWFSDDAAVVKARIADTQRVFDRFARLPSIVVARMSGFALGGGYELALAADYRVADSSARVGLPEVTLGLCPGWGGTVRSSRLLGAKAATDFVLSGRPVKAASALECGLLDAIADTDDAFEAFVSGELSPTRMTDLGAVTRPEPVTTVDPVPGQLAQASISRLMAKAQLLDLRAAQDAEVDAFVALAQSGEAHALIQRYLNDQATKRAARKAAQGGVPATRVAVLGAGIMGAGIAWQCAVSGMAVVVKDIQAEALDAARHEMQRLGAGQIKKQRMSDEQVAAVQARVSYDLAIEAIGDCDLVIEAVTERADIKTAVLQQAEAAVAASALVTSNTSTLAITGLAQGMLRPAQFGGLHFFNPVPVMPLVEVIVGKDTAAATTANLVATATALGKRAVVVQDCPGFLVNRVLFPYLNAFDTMLALGQSVERVDQTMAEFGWPMGPGFLADVIGIDTCVHASDVMAAAFPDRMTPPPLSSLRVLHQRGQLGQKSGRGFYHYAPAANGRLERGQPADLELGLPVQEPMESADILGLMMAPMIEELARCVSEGVIESAAVADCACLMGLGFPAYHGGPLYWAHANGFWDGRTDALALAAREFY